MAMPYLSQVSITLSSRMLPPACAIYSTPLLWARSILSPKGKKAIAAQCHALVLGEPLTALFCGERFWLLGEEHLPSAVAQHVFPLVRDIHVDGVVAVGATYAWLEGERHYLGTLPHPPCVGLAASQTGAVDTALLSGADTDGLTVLDVAYRVALGIFQGDEGDDQVTASLIGEGLVLGRDVLKESGGRRGVSRCVPARR